MNLQLPQMDRLPLTPAALGAMAAVLVVAVGGYFGLVWPSSRQVSELEARLAGLSAQAAAIAPDEPPVTDVERASWQNVEARVRERFILPDDQYQLIVELGRLARASGMAVVDVQIEGMGAPAAGAPATPAPAAAGFAMPVPPTLSLNPGVVRLSVRHQYPALVAFLDRLATANTYVAVQTFDVRRVGTVLESDIRVVSFRWAQAQ